ncbi:MAG TPA: BadF/BadG/BcrA/BcrD ATPase family protein [Acidobacteriaceae bacterium]|nr:BadF/BadG/BcrA/BcrD ATPase family protein [Acidobacteriaceae bacterium]
MRYFLGIDAGGTKTVGALADEERELARAEGGTIKLLRTGKEDARKNLASLLTQLASRAGIELSSVSRICIGTSGASVPLVANWIRETVPLLTGGELLLCGDEEIALDAAFRGGPGILVVAGTGSNVAGRTHDGQIAHAGGWGPALGDEGSGYWIGQQALRLGFRALDENRPTQLLQSILHHWKLAGIDTLVEAANATPSPDFSRLAPVVIACAAEGDALALELLQKAGEELARLALLVLRQLRRMGELPAPRVGFTGSVLANSGQVRASMIHALLRESPEMEILQEAIDPIQGAIWRARTSAVEPAGRSARPADGGNRTRQK